jgi:hypothetical protein
VRPHNWESRRSLYFIEKELRRMRRARLVQLRERLTPMPAEQYADQAVALMSEAIDQDPVPVPIDWAAHALGLDPEPRPEDR